MRQRHLFIATRIFYVTAVLLIYKRFSRENSAETHRPTVEGDSAPVTSIKLHMQVRKVATGKVASVRRVIYNVNSSTAIFFFSKRNEINMGDIKEVDACGETETV